MKQRGMDLVQRTVREGFDDLKVNIRCLADFVATGITDNRETTKEVKQLVDDNKYISYQTSCHDSRIEDHDMDLKEMMGKIDRMQEDIQNLVQLNQGSHVQDNPTPTAQRMEEDSITQPVGFSRQT